jgi:hypothetical protein
MRISTISVDLLNSQLEGFYMKTKRFLTAFSLLALLLVAPTKAARPTVVTMNIDGYVAGCHEAVHITGEVTQLLQLSTAKNNFLHFDIHLNGHLDGEGFTTGATYNANVSENWEGNGSFPTSGEFNHVIRMNLISRGSEPNFQLKFDQHLTINAKGEIVVDRIDLSEECHG